MTNTQYQREYQRRRRLDPEAKAKDREYSRTYRERNRERLNEQSRAYYHANKAVVAEKRKLRLRDTVLAKYGLTSDEYDTLLKQQGGCAICGVAEDQRGRSMPVDHDHATNAVRGILCSNCNLLLGYARDSVATLRAAITYLSR